MKNTIKLSFMALVLLLVSGACQKEESYGYLKVDLNTLESAIESKAVMQVPAGYDAKRLYVEIKDAYGTVIKSTDDYANDTEFKGTLKLIPGTYTVNASSYGWDGSNSGFDTPYYTGSSKVTVAAKELRSVNVVCTLANVKVSVTYDNSFKIYFKYASTSVQNLADENISSRNFTMGSTSKAAYFPEGDLALILNVINMKNNAFVQMDTIRTAKAREHIRINYKVADAGTMGGVTVSVDDATRTYNFNIPIPRKPGISFECYQPAGSWSNFADLKFEITGKTAGFDFNKLCLQWKASGTSTWNDVPYSSLTKVNDDFYTYKLTGLSKSSNYQYRVHYSADDTVDSDIIDFATGTQTALYNSGFEYWYTNNSSQYPDEKGVSYWDTSNPGSASFGGSVTVQETGFKHGGNSCAKLQTKYLAIKLAAGSMYSGAFQGLIGTSGAKLDWGVPFTSKPTSLKGYLSYAPGKINKGTKPSGAADKDSNDHCSIFCALLTQQLHVGGNASADGYEKSTTINWQTDSRIIAYGELDKSNSSNGQWEAFEIPLVYNSTTKTPTHLLIVCSSSKWGDYFYGSDSSVLYLDDFELVYGYYPTIKQ